MYALTTAANFSACLGMLVVLLGMEASHLGSITQGVAYKVLFCLSVCLSLFVSPCAANKKIAGREKLINKCSVEVYVWFVL